MARKLNISLSLLALVLVLTGASFADAIPTQITLGQSTTGSITVGPTSVSFNDISGYAYEGTSPGTYTMGTGNVALSGSKLPASSVSLSVTIPGSGTLSGMMTLSVESVGPLYIFYGTFDPTTALGPLPKGFAPGQQGEVDFTVYNANVSSGELQPDSVPEPGTIAMVGSGLLVAAGMLRRKL